MKPFEIVLVQLQLGSVIDLFLATSKYLFQKATSFETGISNHLIVMVLQTTYERFSTKLLTYGSYEQPWNDSHINKFKSEALRNLVCRYQISKICKSLNTVAPFKKRIV